MGNCMAMPTSRKSASFSARDLSASFLPSSSMLQNCPTLVPWPSSLVEAWQARRCARGARCFPQDTAGKGPECRSCDIMVVVWLVPGNAEQKQQARHRAPAANSPNTKWSRPCKGDSGWLSQRATLNNLRSRGRLRPACG